MAMELRLFILYIGKIVLKSIIPIECYNHFVVLNIALGILLIDKSSINNNLIEKSRNLIKYFIQEGGAFATNNTHSLLHLPDDSIINGSIENQSAFCFENYLQ